MNDWKPKNWVLVLFLYLAFTLIAGYGVFLFGGNMGNLQKIGYTILFVSLVGGLIGGGILYGCRKCPEQEPKTNKTCETLPSFEFTVQEGCSNPRKISVSIIRVNCKQGEEK